MAAIRSGYPSKRTSVWHEIRKHYVLLLFVLLPLIHIMLFCYKPMYGVILAFKKYDFGLGIWGSKWVGLKHFQKFFKSYRFEQMLTNTLVINIYALLLSVPLPMGLALVLHYVNGKRLSKATHMITYAPHFISNVVMVSMLSLMLAKGSGVVNGIFRNMGLEAVDFLGKSALFKHLYVWSDVWQHNGWQAIIYIATLSSVPPELYEAAVIDGAGKLQRIRYIDIQALLPTATILLIMSCGNIMNISFEKIYLMQNSMNISASEVISTYVYKAAFAEGKYDYSTAINLFSSVVNFALLISVNLVARKLSDTSLF